MTMASSDGIHCKLIILDQGLTAVCRKTISELPETFVEQIFRHLDIKTLFVIAPVCKTFESCVDQVLKEVTQLALICVPEGGKPNFDLLPETAVTLDELCRIKHHRFPKWNVLMGFADCEKNEQFAVSILKKVPNLKVLHLEIGFGMCPASERKASIANFERCALMNHKSCESDCQQRMLPSQVAELVGNSSKLVHVSIPRYSSGPNAITPIDWKNKSEITCFHYGDHGQDSKISQFANLKSLGGRIYNDDVLKSVLGNGLVNHREMNLTAVARNWKIATGLEFINIQDKDGGPLKSVLSNFKNLRQARLWVNLSILKSFADLQNLEILEIAANLRNDEVTEAVSTFKSFGHRLKALSICSPGNSWWKAISYCPNLEFFEMYHIFRASDVIYFSKLSKLQFLGLCFLHDSVTQELFFDFLKTLPSLRFLQFDEELINDVHSISQLEMIANSRSAFPKIIGAPGNLTGCIKDRIIPFAKLHYGIGFDPDC